MKFSEAIRLSAMLFEQGFGNLRHKPNKYLPESRCALGCALGAAGKAVNYKAAARAFPVLSTKDARCPACFYNGSVQEVVIHLNDLERWPLNKIADWVAAIEPREDATEPLLDGRTQSDGAEELAEAKA
jgi:hypothetical protein